MADDSGAEALSGAPHILAVLVRTARKRQEWDQAETAARAGLERRTLIRIEAGDKASHQPEHLRALAATLSISSIDISIAAGYLNLDEAPAAPLWLLTQVAIETSKDPAAPQAAKNFAAEILHQAQQRHSSKLGTSSAELFYASLGKPVPAPLTPQELKEFEQEMDAADAAAARRYGAPGRRNVA